MECCFYIYNRDNGIVCEYTPDVKFKYQYAGKDHWYFPDFMMPTGELVEIKGGHFFKDGKMICPFRDKKWSDKKYLEICDVYEAKHQCMLEYNVKIFTWKEIKPIIEYMNAKYSKNWLQYFITEGEK